MVARRMSSMHADDLVSEAFQAVHHNVVRAGVGPQDAFRPYLFQVMRNIASRWRREGERFVDDPDFEQIDEVDALAELVRGDDTVRLLDAFRDLPERWQRVLWLSDVERVGRPQVAADLGLSLNAASVLRRRALAGLRLQWLLQHVPESLRDDDNHVAALLPAVVLGRASATEKSRVRAHVAACARCQALHADLREVHTRPSTAVFSLAGLAAPAAPAPITAPRLAVGDSEAPLPTPSVSEAGIPEAEASPPSIIGFGPRDIDVAPTPKPNHTPPPAASPGTVPTPPDADPDPGPGVGPILIDLPVPPEVPVVTVLAAAGTYVAPVLSGTAPLGSGVAVEIDGTVFATAVQADGAWSYDLRDHYLAPGSHEARVWSYTDTAASSAQTFAFEVTALGIEGLEPHTELTIANAIATPFLVTLTGPPGGTACLAHDLPDPESPLVEFWSTVFEIPLDGDGRATRGLSFLGVGDYAFDIFLCNEGSQLRTGPPTSFTVSVLQPPFGGWGPGLPFRYMLVQE